MRRPQYLKGPSTCFDQTAVFYSVVSRQVGYFFQFLWQICFKVEIFFVRKLTTPCHSVVANEVIPLRFKSAIEWLKLGLAETILCVSEKDVVQKNRAMHMQLF